MRVGVNARTFSVEEPRGSEQASINSVRHLAGLADTTVHLFGHESLSARFPELPVIDRGFLWNSQAFGLLWEQASLPNLLESTDTDVLFCPNSDGPLRSLSTPVVVRIHDLFGYRGNGPALYTALQRIRIPRMVALADVIVTPTAKVKSAVESRFSVSNVEVVPNGINEYFFTEDTEDAVDVPEDYLLYVGGTGPRKNVHGLLTAFKRVKSMVDADMKLVCVGPESRFIDGVTDDNHSLEKRDVINIGYITEAQLKYVYENANVYVNPSYDEGFGLTPLEAMACGTPVASSNRPPMPEVLGDVPVYFDPDDPTGMAEAIYQLLDSPEFRAECVASGKRRASNFRWSTAAKEIYAVLKRTV